jgi:hypothetical protein
MDFLYIDYDARVRIKFFPILFKAKKSFEPGHYNGYELRGPLIHIHYDARVQIIFLL